jgi:RecA-family ATPase
VRFIGVDPITAAQSVKRDVWSEHNDFLQQAKQSAVEYGCSILFVTHPVKRMSQPDINQLAGSAAFGRFCQSALWLDYVDQTSGDIKTQLGTTSAQYNRVLHILKARNSTGQGIRLACTFDREDLSLKEIGMIVRNKQRTVEVM